MALLRKSRRERSGRRLVGIALLAGTVCKALHCRELRDAKHNPDPPFSPVSLRADYTCDQLTEANERPSYLRMLQSTERAGFYSCSVPQLRGAAQELDSS